MAIPIPEKLGLLKNQQSQVVTILLEMLGWQSQLFRPQCKTISNSVFFFEAPQLPWDDNRIVSKHAVAQGIRWDCAGIV